MRTMLKIHEAKADFSNALSIFARRFEKYGVQVIK